MVLAEYLDDERARLAPKTFGNYENVIELLEHSLNGYAYQSLDQRDLERPRTTGVVGQHRARSAERRIVEVGNVYP